MSKNREEQVESAPFRMILKDGNLNISPRSVRVTRKDLYHDLLGLSWPRFTLWFALAFLVMNSVFGLVYFLIPSRQFAGLRYESGLERFLESFFFSVQTMGTIGYGQISPLGFLANCAVTVECYAGIFFAALMTGLIFARFARPHVKVVFSRNAVIRTFDGVPCLMFRIANERQNHITDARVKVFLVMNDPKTGYREFTELALERNESPLFALSWTIAHDITPSSPLHGQTSGSLRARAAEIVVSFRGTDTALSQEMHAKTSYVVEEILMDHDFVDVIERMPGGAASLNMNNFNEVRKLPPFTAPEVPGSRA